MHKTRIIVCVLALVLGLGLAARAAQFSDYLPDTSMLYVSWELTGKTLTDYQQSQLYKMIEDPDFQKLLNKGPKDSKEELGLTADEVRQLLHSRMAFAIVEYDKPKNKSADPEPKMAMMIDTSDPKIQKLITKFKVRGAKKAVEKGDKITTEVFEGITITVYHNADTDEDNAIFSHKDTFIAASTVKIAKGIIHAINKGIANPLTKAPNFIAAHKKAPENALMWGYFSFEKLNKALSITEMLAEDEMDAFYAEMLGIADLHTVAFSVVCDADQLALNFNLLGLKADAPLMKIMKTQATETKCLNALRKTFGRHYVAVSLDVANLWDELQKFDGTRGRLDIVKEIKGFEQACGIDFKKDVVPNLGGEAMMFFAEGSMEDICLVATINNKAKIEQAFLPLIKSNSGYKKTSYKGATVHVTNTGGVLAFNNDFLVFAASEKMAHDALDCLASNGASIASTDEFKKINKLIGGKACVLLRVSLTEMIAMVGSMFSSQEPEDWGDDEDEGEGEEWDEEEWGDEGDGDLVGDEDAGARAKMIAMLKLQIAELERVLAELKKIREQVKASGADTAVIDTKIAEVEEQITESKTKLAQLQNQEVEIPEYPREGGEEGKEGDEEPGPNFADIITKYFKYLYMALVPDGDGVTIKIILR